jgi:heme/copper-type cytochrome/quinol oxidase subunit 1
MFNEAVGRTCALGVFFGFNLTFMPQFVMGSRGMPRRYWDYDPEFKIFHQLSTIGAFILGISIFVSLVSLMASFKTGKKAPRNPWGGTTLEWDAPTPPPLYNFEAAHPPVLHELYNYDDLVEVSEDNWERRPAVAPEEQKIEPSEHVKAAERAEANAEAKVETAKADDAKIESKSDGPAPVVEAAKADEAKLEAKVEDAKVETAKADTAKAEAKADDGDKS